MNNENLNIDEIKKFTMLTKPHLLYLEQIINEINNLNIEGSIVECGVWKGGAIMWMLLCQKKFNTNRLCYLYDTFEGMTEPDDNDGNAKDIYKRIENGKYKRDYDKWHNINKWAYAPIELVKNNINKINYDNNNIIYVKGDCCETLNEIVPKKISIVRLDTDWYNSTKKELDVLFPFVTKNGYIIIDDYHHWDGSRKATDEFIEINRNNIEIIDKKKTGGVFVFKKIID